MKHRTRMLCSYLILGFTLLNLSCAEVQPQLKTIQLMNGKEVADIGGEWKVDYEFYGIYRALSGYSNQVRIFQDQDKFVAVVSMTDQIFTKGTEVIKGKLSKEGFKTVQLFTKDKGWQDCVGRIRDNGNRIVLSETYQTRTLTREK